LLGAVGWALKPHIYTKNRPESYRSLILDDEPILVEKVADSEGSQQGTDNQSAASPTIH
jgi:hypothetical protein